jgi:radical SAM superfamily enzyme YgiQ (UPF0313 family)
VYRHVLCVFPYRRKNRPRAVHYPPLGLEIVAAALKPFAREIDVVDLRLEAGRTVDFLRAETDLVCFSVNWAWDPAFVREEVRSVPARILTVVGGRHATYDPEVWFADCPNVDIVVRGDGEDAVREIALGVPLEAIAGASFQRSKEILHNPPRRYGALSEELYPDRHLRRYVYSVPQGGGWGSLTADCVASSRGCPFNCKFCSQNKNPWGTKRNWAARSPESVVREIEKIEAKVVFFVDDNFAHDMDRIGAICDLLTARGIRKRFVFEGRVDIARRPDVLGKMERAGFSAVFLGVESAQDRTLRSMRKGFTTRQVRERFRILRKSRMILHGFFMLGLIGEDEEEMLEIAPYARELGLDTLSLTILRNDPYTGLEELVARSPGYHIAPTGEIYSDRYSLERLRDLRRRICREFYTPAQALRVIVKGVRNRLLTAGLFARAAGGVAARMLSWRRPGT